MALLSLLKVSILIAVIVRDGHGGWPFVMSEYWSLSPTDWPSPPSSGSTAEVAEAEGGQSTLVSDKQIPLNLDPAASTTNPC